MNDNEFESVACVRAQSWDLLAALLLDEPGSDMLERLAEGVPEGIDAWAATAAGLQAARAAGTFDDAAQDIRVDYAGLFANASHAPVHPYESAYLSADRLLMQDQRDQVVAAYLQESFAVDEELHLPEDHAGIECAFMARLCQREAASEDQASLRAAERAFVEDHVLAWIPQLCADMRERANTDFYRDFADVLERFVRAEALFLAEEGGLK